MKVHSECAKCACNEQCMNIQAVLYHILEDGKKRCGYTEKYFKVTLDRIQFTCQFNNKIGVSQKLLGRKYLEISEVEDTCATLEQIIQ